ncbi:hypothetical protein [Microcoleus sp.]|uniref:hypothetical protein n=1 Tax=Microcoleus sp. TaxID=44472 RepID=UPI003524190C
MACEPIELNLDRMFGIFCDRCRNLQAWCDRAGSRHRILLLALGLVTGQVD